jgi:hypothetical protein
VPKSKPKPKPAPKPKRKPAPAPKPASKVKPKASAKSAPKVAAKKPTVEADADYGKYKDRQAAISRARSLRGREAGIAPDIEDVERRERCAKSLKLFCETYMSEAFALRWSEDHLSAITRIEEAVFKGALYAYAMARGSGKTTLARAATLWATLNSLCRYVFVIGATDAKARDTLESLKTLIRFNETLAADYPEVSHYARALAGIANRASGQTCEGVSTLIDWSSDGIVLPTVPPPANWPKAWPLRADGMVPTAGAVIATSGLTGEGIRGSLKTLSTGEMVRPDLVLLDDPQTPESARSKTQNRTREQLVSADVLGMAGPGRTIAAVMPCTVIEPGDFIDSILDRAKHPLWRGERSGILRSLPTDLPAWDSYFEVYRRCAQLEPPDFAEANAYYLAHREQLEAGSVAAWEDRKLPDEVSAIQHAMHLRFRDPFAFSAEYMNRPQPFNAGAASGALDAEFVAAKVTNLARLVVPRTATRVTAMIDVGMSLLWYVVTAWDEKFNGWVIDYGPYPDQVRPYFAESDARTLADLPTAKGMGQEAQLYAGLAALSARVLGRAYVQEETGTEFRVGRCLVDANYGPATDLVYDFCRRDQHAGVLLPSHGKFIGVSSAPMAAWAIKPGEQAGPGWRVNTAATGKRGRKAVVDANNWKTFTAARLRTPAGSIGCLSLFAPDAAAGGHELYADHCAAEYPVAGKRVAGGPVVNEWQQPPGRPNHLWDCTVGSAVAVSIQGLRFDAGAASGAVGEVPAAQPQISFSEMQRLAREKRAKAHHRR